MRKQVVRVEINVAHSYDCTSWPGAKTRTSQRVGVLLVVRTPLLPRRKSLGSESHSIPDGFTTRYSAPYETKGEKACVACAHIVASRCCITFDARPLSRATTRQAARHSTHALSAVCQRGRREREETRAQHPPSTPRRDEGSAAASSRAPHLARKERHVDMCAEAAEPLGRARVEPARSNERIAHRTNFDQPDRADAAGFSASSAVQSGARAGGELWLSDARHLGLMPAVGRGQQSAWETGWRSAHVHPSSSNRWRCARAICLRTKAPQSRPPPN